MRRALKTHNGIYHHNKDGEMIEGPPPGVRGCLSGVSGDLSGVSGYLSGVRGNLSGVWGDLSGVSGNMSGVWGDLSGVRGCLSGVWGNMSGVSGYLSGVSGDISGVRGDLSGVSGDLSGVSGNLSGVRGNLSGVRGDLSGVSGYLSGVRGNLDDCEITDADRERGVQIADLIDQGDYTPPGDSPRGAAGLAHNADISEPQAQAILDLCREAELLEDRRCPDCGAWWRHHEGCSISRRTPRAVVRCACCEHLVESDDCEPDDNGLPVCSECRSDKIASIPLVVPGRLDPAHLPDDHPDKK